jgi:hypothetical protein
MQMNLSHFEKLCNIGLRPQRSTRSFSHFILLYPPVSSLKFSYRSFPHAAPRLLNQLPPDLRPSVPPPFTFPHLSCLPVTAHLPPTLAAFYLNLKPIFSFNPFHLRSYLFLGLSLRIPTLNLLSSPLLTILSFIFNRYIFSLHECGRLC